MTAPTTSVAWFTPFQKKSSIGQFSQAVTQQLSTQARVDLWVAETGDLLDTSLRLIPFARISRYENWLQEYDYVVYNLGNQTEDHGHIYNASQRHKGIVILHDFVAPEPVVGAEGVIVHSDLLRDRVSMITSAPAAKIQFPYAVDRTSTRSRSDLGVPNDRLLAVTIGDFNENRYIEAVLRTISDDDLKNRIYYIVLGSFDTPYGQRMLELRRELCLQDAVHFAGLANEDLVRAALTHADICIDLLYSEIPSDASLKVRPDYEFEDLSRNLRALVSDETLRRALGPAAVRFASQHFSPEVYASQFLHFCREIAVYQPAFRLAELVAAELRAIGVTPDMAIVDTVARQAAALLDGGWDPPILRKTRDMT